MVPHAADYPWSSYQFNGVGRAISLITPHQEYLALGGTEKARLLAYRCFFKGCMQQKDTAEINESINKEWVLGCYRFKNKDKDKEATWQKTIAAWWQ
jgi:putative transposase